MFFISDNLLFWDRYSDAVVRGICSFSPSGGAQQYIPAYPPTDAVLWIHKN